MSEYKCLVCEFRFCSEDEIPYCPICDCEKLGKIKEVIIINKSEKMEEHHIHPRFMDNKSGGGKKYLITKKQHSIIHGKIMNCIWECIREEDKKKTIDYIISKSKEFIGEK